MRISTAKFCQLLSRDECDAPQNILDVLSVGSRSGFVRSGRGRVEVIVVTMNGITSDNVM